MENSESVNNGMKMSTLYRKEPAGRSVKDGGTIMKKLLCLMMAFLLAFGTAAFAEEAAGSLSV